MEFLKLLYFATFLSLAIVESQADLDGYWKSKLPNVRMPKLVRDLLHNDWFEDKSSSVIIGKGTGVDINTGKGTHVAVGHGGVGVNTGKSRTIARVGPGGVDVYPGHKAHLYVSDGNFVIYNFAATENQLHGHPNMPQFFLEKDLHRGNTMNLYFTKSPHTAGFLPRKVADSIPFSSESIPEILNRFEFKSDSAEAKVLKKTINECEQPGIKGEEKYCATSLESMIDFTTSKLGENVKAVSTEVQKETKTSQKYKIADAKKLNSNYQAMVCHRQNYVYAVFYCHTTQNTEAYEVYLVGADRTKAKAVAVCHKDTAAWNPKNLAFQELKVKPGSVPVCHFLPDDHVVWVSK